MRPSARCWALVCGCAAGGLCCTSVTVGGKWTGGTPAIGRTMELGFSSALANWTITSHRKGETMGRAPVTMLSTLLCGSSMEWVNNYTFVGMEATSELAIGIAGLFPEGMNERGLTVSALTFRKSQYPPWEWGNNSTALPPLCHVKVVPYLLGRCATVAEAKAALRGVAVGCDVRAIAAAAVDEMFFHWHITDATGDAAVVEYIGGELVWTPDRTGVLTNDPSYDWHVSNLNNYVALSPTLPKGQSGSNQGTNLLGLPGDWSPASRFVRMYYLRQFTTVADPPDPTLVMLQGLLNTVHIVAGTVGEKKKQRSWEKTHWSVMKVPAHRLFYARSYSGLEWNVVNVTQLAALPPALAHGAGSTHPRVGLPERVLSATDVTRKL